MKRLTSLTAVFAACLCALVTSCSDKYDSVEKQAKTFIPDEVSLVANIDLDRMVKVTDSKVNGKGVIELSDYMERLLSRTLGSQARTLMANLSDFKGMQVSNMLVAFDKVSNRALVLTPLRNEKNFVESLVSIGSLNFDKLPDIEGYGVVESPDMTVLVKDNLAFIAIDGKGALQGQQAVNMVEAWHDKAAKKHLDDWKIDRLKKDDIVSVLIDVNTFTRAMTSTNPKMGDLDAFADWMALGMDIEKNEFEISAKALTDKGKDAEVKGMRNFDTSLLSYVTTSDIVVAGVGMDMKTVRNGLDQIAMSEGVSEADRAKLDEAVQLFDGSVMLAAGPVAGLSSFTQFDLTTWHFVLAANADGKAVKALIEHNMGRNFEADGSMSVPAGTRFNPETMEYEPATLRIYTRADKHVFVISNSPVTTDGNANVKKDAFKGHYFGLWAELPKSNVALSQLHLPFGLLLTGEAKKNESEFTLKLTDTDKSFVEALVVAFIGEK